jgi:hypothetical protein
MAFESHTGSLDVSDVQKRCSTIFHVNLQNVSIDPVICVPVPSFVGRASVDSSPSVCEGPCGDIVHVTASLVVGGRASFTLERW